MGQAISSESSKGASEGDEVTSTVNNTQQNSSGEKVEINVNMNPVIKIEGNNMDKEEIFQVLQERMSEMVDDFGNEIAERMSISWGYKNPQGTGNKGNIMVWNLSGKSKKKSFFCVSVG